MVERGAESARLPHGDGGAGEAVAVVADDAVCQLDDVRERTEVVFQIKVGLGRVTDEELGMGASPFVDGLVGVSDDEEVAVAPAQDREEFPVGAAAVLRFVDHDVLEAPLPAFPHGGEIVQDVQREKEQVIEVEGEIAPLPQDHLPENGNVTGSPGRRGNDEARDVGGRRFEGGQFGHIVPDNAALALDAILFQDLLHEDLHVFFVEDDIVLGVTEAVDFLAQEAHAEAVDGRHEVPDHAAWAEGCDACLHLVGGLVREGHAEDVALGNAQVVQEIGIAVDEGAGLAGSGAGYDADSSFGLLDGILLFKGQGRKVDGDSGHACFELLCKDNSPECQKLTLCDFCTLFLYLDSFDFAHV